MTSVLKVWVFEPLCCDPSRRPCGLLRRSSKAAAVDSFLPLLEQLPSVTPPVGLLARIEAEIDDLERPQARQRIESAKPRKVRRFFLAGFLGSVISLAAAWVVMDPNWPGQFDQPSPLAILIGQDGQPQLEVRALEGGPYLELKLHGRLAASGRVHELWLISKGAKAPKSLGTLSTTGQTTVLPLEATLSVGDLLAVSDELGSRSRRSMPTGPVIMSGSVRSGGPSN
jgi:anti-sigma-K factor RskA